MNDIVASFDALSRPPMNGVEQYSVAPIGQGSCQLGKSVTGAPALLVGVQPAPARDRPAPIVLEHVRVQHDVDCDVLRSDGGEGTERFTVIVCTGPERLMQEHFLLAVPSVVLALERLPSKTDVTLAITTLVDLFRSMSRPSRRSVQGLWGELFVLAQSCNVVAALAAWHTEPEDRFDFNAGEQRLEVKSSTTRDRSHHFSLEQVRPPDGVRVVIASLFVEPIAAGTSVVDLTEAVRSRVSSDPTLQLHLDRVVRLSLGQAWRQGMQERFDRQLATGSLRFYRAEDVPSIPLPVPHEVTEVRYKADLKGTTPADLQGLIAGGGLFAAVIRPT